MRKQLILMTLLFCTALSASARVSVSIGIHVPIFPRLVQVPSYPVYYAPELDSNYFFYDGAYWVYQDDYWYSSQWYDGPWDLVEPEFVPSFILRVPVRYYRLPPRYFIGWHQNAPPQWHVHWGHHWAERRSGWDHWDRRSVHTPAPLPVYQRNYSGDRYPRQREQQHDVRNRHYNYRPRESIGHTRNQQPERERYSRSRDQTTTQDTRQQRGQHRDQYRDEQSNPRWDRQRNEASRHAVPSQQGTPQQTMRREPRNEPRNEQRRDQSEQHRSDAPRQLMPAQRNRDEQRRFSQRNRQPEQESTRIGVPSRQLMGREQDSLRVEQRERRVQSRQQTVAPDRSQQGRAQHAEQRPHRREQRADHAQRSSEHNNRGKHDRGQGHDRDRSSERR